MNRRSLLRGQFWRAWQRTIQNEYSDQLINSERALQLYFCTHLGNEFSEKSRLKRSFLIEPPFRNRETKEKCRPDVLVCDREKVIAVVELKYQPHKKPAYKKDVEKLAYIAKALERFEVYNNRFRGTKKFKSPFFLADNALFVWAGVYREEYDEVTQKIDPIIQRQFLAFHAVAHNDSDPDIYCSTPTQSRSKEIAE